VRCPPRYCCGSGSPYREAEYREQFLALYPLTVSVAMRYPETLPLERDAWILARRAAAQQTSIRCGRGRFLSRTSECSASGEIVASCDRCFLTNRECPWRCLMCDLWRNTLASRDGPWCSIPAQIDHALERLTASTPDQALQQRQLLRPEGDPSGRLCGNCRPRIEGYERVIVEMPSGTDRR
jgi:hypothetical protein